MDLRNRTKSQRLPIGEACSGSTVTWKALTRLHSDYGAIRALLTTAGRSRHFDSIIVVK